MEVVARVLVVSAWLVWAAPSITWAARGWAETEDGALQGVMLGLGLASVGAELARGLDRPAAGWPLVTIALGALAAVLGPELSAVRAAAVVVSGFGVLGLVVSRPRWGSVAAIVALALLALPVLPIADALVGWPIRRVTAIVAAAALGGIPSETVIAVEGVVTHVDAPCAGLRTWWVGAAALLLAAVHQRAGLGPRVALALALQAAVGFAANVARVAVVVGLAQGLGWPVFAETVHLPLGLLGAAASFAIGWVALPRGQQVTPAAGPARASGAPVWAAALALALAAGAPRVDHRPDPVPAPTLPALFEPVAVSDAEQRFADRFGAALVKGSSGPAAVVLVASRSWLAHHVPTMCLRAAGWTPSHERIVAIDGRPVRQVALSRGGERATALWWFTSDDRVTDDVVERIRDGLLTGRPWTMVSVVVADGVDPAPTVRALWRTAETASVSEPRAWER
ncbi:MAG: archaeosortase/exosortase family protein [Myxococcota bacterium]